MLVRALVCGYMAAARLAELAFSRRNVRLGGEGSEGQASRLTFPLIVAIHTFVIAGTLLRGRRVRWPWLVALAAVQPLRYWALFSLGRSWNARGVVARDMRPVTSGPYAFVRHPNYAVVAVELVALPASFGVNRAAIVAATAINAALLAIRIRDEEARLFQLPGYRESFGRKPRFLPFLF